MAIQGPAALGDMQGDLCVGQIVVQRRSDVAQGSCWMIGRVWPDAQVRWDKTGYMAGSEKDFMCQVEAELETHPIRAFKQQIDEARAIEATNPELEAMESAYSSLELTYEPPQGSQMEDLMRRREELCEELCEIDGMIAAHRETAA